MQVVEYEQAFEQSKFVAPLLEKAYQAKRYEDSVDDHKNCWLNLDQPSLLIVELRVLKLLHI